MLSMLFHSLNSKEEKNALSYILNNEILLRKSTINIKIFYYQHCSLSHVNHCLTFKNNLSVGIVPIQNCYREKEWQVKEGEGKRRGVQKLFSWSFSLQKHHFFFSLFLDFLLDKKLYKHPPIDNAIVHNKTLNLQTKSPTQILKIEKSCNNIINLQRKWKRKSN
jgi:hypothetical protein